MLASLPLLSVENKIYWITYLYFYLVIYIILKYSWIYYLILLLLLYFVDYIYMYILFISNANFTIITLWRKGQLIIWESWFDSKIKCCYTFYRSYFLYGKQKLYQFHTRATECTTKKIEYHFIITFWHLNLVKTISGWFHNKKKIHKLLQNYVQNIKITCNIYWPFHERGHICYH